jgi:hypothetical protein
MNQAPFVIRMLVLDGDPDGIRILDRSNWTGKAVVFPRSLIQKVRSLPEYKKPGVYLLCGAPGEDGATTLYIGEGDPVASRIDQHHAKKDFWTWAVFFSSSDAALNKVHIQYLESELVRLAQEAKRVILDNGNFPQKPSLSAADEAEAMGFLGNMLGILPLLGIHAFERAPAPKTHEAMLFLSSKGISGKGYETSAGFVVCKGSTASKKVAPSMGVEWGKKREALISSGVLRDKGDVLEFIEDFTFTSPSAAAQALRATPSNGWESWKNKDGRTLHQLAQGTQPAEVPES